MRWVCKFWCFLKIIMHLKKAIFFPIYRSYTSSWKRPYRMERFGWCSWKIRNMSWREAEIEFSSRPMKSFTKPVRIMSWPNYIFFSVWHWITQLQCERFFLERLQFCDSSAEMNLTLLCLNLHSILHGFCVCDWLLHVHK